jgi:hypothetical protein
MPTKKLTVEQETQISIIINMLEELGNKVDIAEAARREREKNADELLTKIDHAVFGNGKSGLVLDVKGVVDRVKALGWAIGIIVGIVLTEAVKGYLP